MFRSSSSKTTRDWIIWTDSSFIGSLGRVKSTKRSKCRRERKLIVDCYECYYKEGKVSYGELQQNILLMSLR